MKSRLEKTFAKYLFDDSKMKKFMSPKSFLAYVNKKKLGEPLDECLAKQIAKAIKKWAIKNEVKHFSHWFLPLTNKAAEKQVSFLEKSNGGYIEDFNEKLLLKGEIDASSFPNGGERLTFEARGYTMWDYTSPVFIKEDLSKNKVLYIPTAFCSYNGLSLDEKTPILRASEQLNTQALRVLRLLNEDKTKKVFSCIGAEQEYFLIKESDFEKRFDIKITGRTLLGAVPAKSQEKYSHYSGVIESQISAFMCDVDLELWKMGVPAKIQHNEMAPKQYELVPIFNNANIASDQNQIIMEVISKFAKKYGLVALFHEKPFSFVNGSGKHINWSVLTDAGENLFDVNQENKLVFLTMMTCVISGIDKYYKLLRASTAYRGNDLRLGEREAPPALISVFVGDVVENLLTNFEFNTEGKTESKNNVIDYRVGVIPKLAKDYCDRNRTSPFAFGGNKFEFRMPGSSQSIAWPTVCLITILTKELKDFADKFENKMPNYQEIIKYLKQQIKNHNRIIFNGNGLDKSWQEEAKLRGIKEYKNSLDCYKIFDDEDIIDLFEKTKILNREELKIRKNALTNNYCEDVLVEAKTMCEMCLKKIYPSLNQYLQSLNLTLQNIKGHSLKQLANKLLTSMEEIYKNVLTLKELVEKIEMQTNVDKKSGLIQTTLIPCMEKIREIYDQIEPFIPNNTKPYPFYNDILF